MDQRLSTSIRAVGLLIVAGVASPAAPVMAQVRGLPVFFDPTYSFSSRVGIDIGHGGESNGFTVAASAAHLFYVGNCARLALTGAVGLWNPPGGDSDAELNTGAKVSYLINPCPSPMSVPNPTFRLIGGAGFVKVDDRTVFNVPLGLGIGYMFEIPIARIEPWATPRVHYRESLIVPDESSWDPAFSAGINIGAGSIVGLRVAMDCCTGGVGGGYGLSLWF